MICRESHESAGSAEENLVQTFSGLEFLSFKLSRTRIAQRENSETRTDPFIFLAIAAAIFLAFSSVMVNVAEPLTTEAPDRKSFKTVPFVLNPSDTQRRELERMVDLCIKTVESEVPGGRFSANVPEASSTRSA